MKQKSECVRGIFAEVKIICFCSVVVAPCARWLADDGSQISESVPFNV